MVAGMEQAAEDRELAAAVVLSFASLQRNKGMTRPDKPNKRKAHYTATRASTLRIGAYGRTEVPFIPRKSRPVLTNLLRS